MHRANCFLTLTYNNENLPGDGSLRLEDWQLFVRRVRKNLGAFRYLHCGEYGEENFRPHYHACVFGLDFSSDRFVYKVDRGNTLWRSPTLESLWPLGFATIGGLSFQSAAYVARYVMKKATGPLAEKRYSRLNPETGEVWQVKPEYVTMSRRPGLGSTWFDRYQSDVFPSDEVVHEGRRYRPPRFYSSKLPEKELEEVKVKRRRLVEQRKEDLTPERLSVRERSADARLRQYKRDL